MKLSRKAVCTLASFAMLVTLTATSSFAATCSNAKVTLVGPNLAFPANTAMQVACVSGGKDWTAGSASISLSVHPDITDQILATAFTAISLGRNVYLTATPGAVGGVVTGMYLLNN
jgi:hypothetical protein